MSNARNPGGGEGHAYNKTLLAKLGFADDDRKNPLHDQACQFLAQPEIARRIAQCCLPEARRESISLRIERVHGKIEPVAYQYQDTHCTTTRTEFAVVKGEGQYKTTIGFLDVLLTFSSTWQTKAEVKQEDETYVRKFRVAIEVKVGRVPVTEAIRQINLYREFARPEAWLLATPWTITVAEKTALDREHIKHVLLGDEFRRFATQNEQSPEAASDATF